MHKFGGRLSFERLVEAIPSKFGGCITFDRLVEAIHMKGWLRQYFIRIHVIKPVLLFVFTFSTFFLYIGKVSCFYGVLDYRHQLLDYDFSLGCPSLQYTDSSFWILESFHTLPFWIQLLYKMKMEDYRYTWCMFTLFFGT